MMRQVDCSQRFVFEGLDIRGELVHLSSSYQALLANRVYPGPVRDLLGEFITASVLMSTAVKFDGRLVLQARSEGQIPLIMAECNSAGHLRGIARYTEEAPSNDFLALLRSATLAITLEPERGESYQGIVPLEKSTLAGCLEDYFERSEQLASRFFLCTHNGACAGMLLQQLPPQLVKDADERKDVWETVTSLLATLTREELLTLENDVLLFRLFNQYQLKLFPPRACTHQCSCSRERTAQALNAIGEEEVMDIIAEQGIVEVSCEFCGRQYRFLEQELKLLFESPPLNRIH